MDLEQHRLTMVDHFLWLYRHPYAGPDISREAVGVYIARSSCPWPKIGHDVRAELDKTKDNP